MVNAAITVLVIYMYLGIMVPWLPVLATTTPARLTICTLGHQAVPRLANVLDSMRHTSTRKFWSKNNSHFCWVHILRNFFQRSTWDVISQVMTSWGLNTVHLIIISEAFHQNYKPMKVPYSVPELSSSAPYVSYNEWLGTVHIFGWMFKWSQKSKLRPTRQRIGLSIIGNGRWVKLSPFLHCKSASQLIDAR